jgi:hypothetical protein
MNLTFKMIKMISYKIWGLVNFKTFSGTHAGKYAFLRNFNNYGADAGLLFRAWGWKPSARDH